MSPHAKLTRPIVVVICGNCARSGRSARNPTILSQVRIHREGSRTVLNSFWVTKLLHSYPKSVEESAGWPGEPSETFSKWEARSAAQRTKTFDTVGVSIAELERFDFTSECLHGSHGVQTIDGREVRQALRSALRTRTRQVTLLSHRLGPLWDPGPSDRGVDFNSAADYAEWKDSGR